MKTLFIILLAIAALAIPILLGGGLGLLMDVDFWKGCVITIIPMILAIVLTVLTLFMFSFSP